MAITVYMLQRYIMRSTITSQGWVWAVIPRRVRMGLQAYLVLRAAVDLWVVAVALRVALRARRGESCKSRTASKLALSLSELLWGQKLRTCLHIAFCSSEWPQKRVGEATYAVNFQALHDLQLCHFSSATEWQDVPVFVMLSVSRWI